MPRILPQQISNFGMMQLTEQNKQAIIAYLQPFAPAKIGVFGSYARNEQTNRSDLDILVDFNSPVTLLQFVRMERELGERLGVKVDLVSGNAIKNAILRDAIYNDLQIIYE